MTMTSNAPDRSTMLSTCVASALSESPSTARSVTCPSDPLSSVATRSVSRLTSIAPRMGTSTSEIPPVERLVPIVSERHACLDLRTGRDERLCDVIDGLPCLSSELHARLLGRGLLWDERRRSRSPWRKGSLSSSAGAVIASRQGEYSGDCASITSATSPSSSPAVATTSSSVATPMSSPSSTTGMRRA